MSDVVIIGESSIDDYKMIGLTPAEMIDMLKLMLEIRRFEERVEKLFLVEGELIGPCHLYLGQEAIAVGVIKALKNGDVIVSTYRGHGHALARGVSMEKLMGELYGKEIGTCKGLGGSMHSAMFVEKNIFMATAIVGSGIPIATGIGLGLKYKNSDNIVACFFGDGAATTGAFHEGINMAAVLKLPVLFICENNQYAYSLPFSKSFAGENIAKFASGYGIKSFFVYGNDVFSVYKAAREAVEDVRRYKIPIFIECRTYRQKGHGVYDRALYRPREEVEEWLRNDPIMKFYRRLIELGVLSEEQFKDIDENVKEKVEKAVEEARKGRVIQFEELYKYVYSSK
ncbi:MAG: thiamine pyrophosphate-dependent dehydrogenase E1 component subunit alpha [Nitrososphaerota archaeon]|nr:thiamine pyrophosphate-dependent dehydrogenase E1 component subunit alpha [Nitrososphaerota archaeon]